MSEPLPPRAVRKAVARRRRRGDAGRRFLLFTLALGIPLFLLPAAGGVSEAPPLVDLVPAALAVVALLYLLTMIRGDGASAASRPLRSVAELPVTGTGRVTIVPVVRPRRGSAAASLPLRAHGVRVAPYLLEAIRSGGAGGPGYGAREGGSVWRPPAGVTGIAVIERPEGPAPAAEAPTPLATEPPAPLPEAARPEGISGGEVRAAAGEAITPAAPTPVAASGEGPVPPLRSWPAAAEEDREAAASRERGDGATPAGGGGDAAAEEPSAVEEPAAAATPAPWSVPWAAPADAAVPPVADALAAPLDAPPALPEPRAAQAPAAPGAGLEPPVAEPAEPPSAPPWRPSAHPAAAPAEGAPPAPRPHLSRLAQRGTVLGIDVGSHSTKIVQVRRRRRGRFSVLNFWVLHTPPGCVDAGGLSKPQLLASRLSPLVDDFRLGRRPAVSSLSLQKAMTKIARFPRMSREEVANALRWEAENYVPLPLETSVVDFAVGPLPAGEGEGGEMEVLVVAAPREAVEALAAALEGAGVAPVAVEIESLSGYRALEAMGLVAPDDDDGCTVLLDLGHSASRLSVFKRGLPVVNRATKMGGRDFVEAVARGLGLTVERAEAAVRRWGVRPGTPIHPLVVPVLDALAADLWRSIEFFLVLSKADRVDRIFLTGGNALQPGLAATLDRYLVGRLSERFDQVPSEAALVRLVAPGSLLGLPRHLKALAPELDARFAGALGTALWKG